MVIGGRINFNDAQNAISASVQQISGRGHESAAVSGLCKHVPIVCGYLRGESENAN